MELDGALIFPLFFTGFLSVWVLLMDSENAYVLKRLSEKVSSSWNAQFWNEITVRARSVLGTTAIVLLPAAMFVNVCTWISNGIAGHSNLLIAINTGVAIVFFALVVFERWRWRMFGSGQFVFSIPRWSKALLVAFLIYTVSVFIFDGSRSHREQLGSDSPGGRIQLELTAELKAQNERRLIRGVSNVWILLSSISAAGLLFVKHKEYEGPFGKYNSVVQ
jgi:hypothetical protein